MDTPFVLAIVVVLGILVAIGLVLLVRRRSPERTSPGQPGPDRPSPKISRATAALGAGLRRAWGSGLDEDTWKGLEEALLAADVGVEATTAVVAGVRASHPETASEARQALTRRLRAEFGEKDRALHLVGSPAVILVVGVNGTGKTTSIAKLAALLGRNHKSVLLAAGDTFRAGAAAQLETWGDRLGVPVVSGQEGGDPASVAFDAVESGRARGADVVIVDTAGRLHGKKNLMAELGKIHRVASGGRGAVDEVLLVLDATAGQNGVIQVREFTAAVPVSGIVLTKLDGTAKGGIVIAVERQLGVPIKFVGLGEGIDDLVPFDPDGFVADLLEES
ncbi:MAG TPA: signal recognition particle-docking protein FtsY [Acidimicrobiia bacterium]|nr:signal recognition particle-docking protein FtsY [Acidimicrobiia bacterium]